LRPTSDAGCQAQQQSRRQESHVEPSFWWDDDNGPIVASEVRRATNCSGERIWGGGPQRFFLVGCGGSLTMQPQDWMAKLTADRQTTVTVQPKPRTETDMSTPAQQPSLYERLGGVSPSPRWSMISSIAS